MGVRDRAVSSGAFGGSRGRLAEGDIERAGLRSMGDISAQLREKGYGQSQERAFQEFARRQAERGATAGGLAGLGQQYYGMGAGTGQGLMNIGGQYGGIAPSLQGLQTTDINRQMQLGGLGRGRQQSLMDLGYQNFTGQYNLPMQTLQNVGALTASLGPMAGGYGFAGADQDVALAGAPQYAPATGGIPTPGAGSYQPYTGSNLAGGTPTPPIGGPPRGPGGGTPIVSPFNYNTYGANMPIRAAKGKPLTQAGRRMTALENLAYMLAAAQGQEGRELSDKDLKFHLDMIGRTPSDRDSGRILSDLDSFLTQMGRRGSDRAMKRGKPGYNRRAYGGGIRSLKYNG